MSTTRISEFDLSSERVGQFLELGIRPVAMKDRIQGDMVAWFMLIPTKAFRFDELFEGEWDGSYIPMIVYRTARAAILVPHGEEKKWLRLANHISAITKLETEVRGD